MVHSPDKSAGKLTIVIPTYNRPNMVKRAAMSALKQSYQNIIVQIYDNSESPETEVFLTDLIKGDKRVNYLRHKKNIGSIQNFEYGISRIKSDYFCVISDDDLFVPDFFKSAIDTLTNSTADFVCCQTIAMNEKFEVISPEDRLDEERIYGPGEAIDAMINGGIPYKWSGIIFKNYIKDQVKINKLAGPYADSGFVLHVAARYKCVTKKIIGAIYIVHNNSASSSTTIIKSEWTQWWEHMILDIERDCFVKSDIRSTIRSKIYPNFIFIGLNQLKGALANSDFAKAIQITDGLNDLGYTLLSNLLKCIVKIIESMIPVRYILDKYIKIRYRKKRVQIKKMTVNYCDLVCFAKEMSRP